MNKTVFRDDPNADGSVYSQLTAWVLSKPSSASVKLEPLCSSRETVGFQKGASSSTRPRVFTGYEFICPQCKGHYTSEIALTSHICIPSQ